MGRGRGSWRRGLLCAGLAAALAGAPAIAVAQDGDLAEGRPPPPAGPLDHDATLRLAAARNLAILARSLEPKRADAAADAARRPFLPELSMEGALRQRVGQERRALEWLPQVTWSLPTGTSLLAQGTVTEGLGPSPESRRTLFVELSQALLRGGLATGVGAELDQADLDAAIAREAFRADLNALLAQVDRAYWEVAFARGDVELKRRGRDRSRVQFEETTENIRRGLLAPGDVFVVEEFLVAAELRLNRAEEDRSLAESNLRRLLDLDGRASLGDAVVPDDLGKDPAEVDSAAMIGSKNPGVLAARLAADRAKVGVSGDTRQALPALDAFGSVAVQDGTDPLALALDDDPELRAGLRLSVPLGWGPDVARVARARTELAQRLLEARNAERQAQADVRDAATRLRGRRSRLAMAMKLVELAQQKLVVEQDKYKSGLATLNDVVRFQRDLDDASSAALRARVEVLTARTSVLVARGDLHESVRVVVR